MNPRLEKQREANRIAKQARQQRAGDRRKAKKLRRLKRGEPCRIYRRLREERLRKEYREWKLRLSRSRATTVTVQVNVDTTSTDGLPAMAIQTLFYFVTR